MIFKLLWKNNTTFQLIAASVGSLIGFCLLLISLETFYDIKSIFSVEKELIKPEYIIVNKKLSFLKTLNISNTDFEKSELEKIEKNEFVSDLSPFISNSYQVSAFTNSNSDLPDFYTDLFFEAIPDKYIDIQNDEWKWKQSDSLIPIVIPNDYLNLYNFGFAESQGLPQISGNMIGLVAFTVRIRGNGKKDDFKGKIIGFSDRINTILVPYDFMVWANQIYGEGEKNPSRLVIISKDPSNPELLKFFDENNYETNKEKLKNSKLNTVFRIAVTVTSFISILIILLSLMIFILGFQLLITKSSHKIKILLNLGYKQLYISKFYIFVFIGIIFIINLISFFVLKVIDNKLFIYLSERSFEINEKINTEVIFVGLFFSLFILIFNSLSIYFKIKQLEK